MLTMDDIVREGDPVLRAVAELVTFPLSDEDKKTGQKMLEFLINSQDPEIAEEHELRAGVGIAAPQIAVSKRLIAIHVHDDNDRLYSYILYNPKIRSHSVENACLGGGEGCLSVDREVPGFVVRSARVTVEAFDIDGKPLKLRLKGYPAIVVQHEIDHLNGIMFYDHINKENPSYLPPDVTIYE
ncbi:peptide deformylase [Listeria grandensis FSL F6-0971]|uniref:Peptide deformylase n=1 Tax=Listeria grandensis FSL F6-0971 TaxID=1265819 RepID=W7BCL1_9LIST|nr:peptide deformylase [Listeria grandensis]EUJ22475.1 peptide deformylase [Listeria grandensis FSL F6-0971]